VVVGRHDEGAQGHVAGLAEGERDGLGRAVLGGLAAVGDDRGGVVLAADDDGAAGRDGDLAGAALGRGQLHGRAGAAELDRVEGLRLVAVVEDRRGDDRGALADGVALGLVARLGDHHGVLDLDLAVFHRDGGVVRLDGERLCVVARSACGERGDREREGGSGESAASKAAHGGGNS
jgi:hypothetical protein